MDIKIVTDGWMASKSWRSGFNFIVEHYYNGKFYYGNISAQFYMDRVIFSSVNVTTPKHMFQITPKKVNFWLGERCDISNQHWECSWLTMKEHWKVFWYCSGWEAKNLIYVQRKCRMLYQHSQIYEPKNLCTTAVVRNVHRRGTSWTWRPQMSGHVVHTIHEPLSYCPLGKGIEVKNFGSETSGYRLCGEDIDELLHYWCHQLLWARSLILNPYLTM